MRDGKRGLSWVVERLGGPARVHVITVFALVLALNPADQGAIGAMAEKLEQAFHISKAAVGLLITVMMLVGAAAAIPFGWLADRVRRTRVLAISILLWAVASGINAAATSYGHLLVGRALLGAFAASAFPLTASLVGDYFPAAERGRIFGYILAGEIVGTGFGFVLAGELALISWRLGFVTLALLALGIAWFVERLPEPARDGSNRLLFGQARIERTELALLSDEGDTPRLSQLKTREAGVTPRAQLVLDVDPQTKSLWWALRYVLRIPSNVLLIVVSALGYYFFAGIRTFGVEFIGDYFNLPDAAAIGALAGLGIGGLIGVYAGGALGDALLARGRLSGRVLVASCASMASAGLFFGGLLVSSWGLAMILLFVAAFALGVLNPPLDAARLDIMHPRLWGRAEAIRILLRQSAEGMAPLLFGYVADQFGGNAGLRDAFLVMLGPFFVSGLIGLSALRAFPRDVATADAYAQRTGEQPA